MFDLIENWTFRIENDPAACSVTMDEEKATIGLESKAYNKMALFKPKDDMHNAFESRGIDRDKPSMLEELRELYVQARDDEKTKTGMMAVMNGEDEVLWQNVHKRQTSLKIFINGMEN